MATKKKIHFEISERKILLRILDVVSVLIALFLVGNIFQFDYFNFTSDVGIWIVILTIYLSIFATIFELYDLQKASKLDVVVKNIILTTSLTVLFYLLTPFFTPTLPENRLQIIYFFISIATALFLWRLAYITLISSPRFYKRVLVVGDSFDIEHICSALQKNDPNYVVVGFINTSDDAKDPIGNLKRFFGENLEEIIKENHIGEIVVSSSYNEGSMSPIYDQLIKLLKSGFPIREYNQVYEEVTHRIPVQHMEKDFYKFFPFSRSNQNQLYLVYNRLFDIIFSLIGSLLGIVLIGFVFIGNFCGNRGNIFYRQERIGKNGQSFMIYKFRTMVKDAEIHGAQWAQENDLRVTKFGKFLRKTRLDEFPQFYNILKGEMSFIGPRPERPMFVKELTEIIPFYEVRHIVKPGLTGWAQVKTPYGSSFADSLRKLQYDLYYIKHRGVFLDYKIIMKTLSTIIFYRGQ
ncbi:MAG TPA: sugar transferase [Salinimicrobium sp.]|nr:sugar transferase [Salinimicrobium sp.]